MKVTDEQVATLRAQLSGDTDEYVQRLDEITSPESQTSYTTLITAAFFEAVDRHFVVNGKAADDRDIIDFVATKREINPIAAEQLDPTVAEQVLAHALGKGSIPTEIDSDTLMQTQVLLLAALIGEADLSDSELETFLSKARAEADEHLD
ncbi:hypothetical protein BZB76_6824 [Actinomadura pelletieri DSM 43383]|uniref:Uncharacterized protein n=1 Tax=Actinomadura pelletieri DSM 43383 TaxID=1120940 RepID=A0A495Q8R1_9ACTN|nr:hypothetical protein [Actinomadura pelletieri]RKS67699.1 hypothetical protein BZB76_6824 [Actinomadura pelletieri DSM 43383]